MSEIDFAAFDALTFDCYGTLIDWETGIERALRAALPPRDPAPGTDELLESFARHEAAAEAGPYLTYRQVLARAAEGICADLGLEPDPDGIRAFSSSVPDWPAFADTPAALRRLAGRFRLGVITNCDDDLFAATNRRLGMTFD